MTVQVRTAVGSNQGKAGQAVRKTDVSTHRTVHKASPYESEGIYQYFYTPTEKNTMNCLLDLY
ncbi:hypothetical protein CIJ63_04810 [Neisseria meningitidis]|uniref:Uncharacterized protein n=1 Tax=Neisseria meningitidis TaxID=487 RepID=A0AB36RW28_NEIME|nr:hypothetical protein CQR35_08250 [Neisseria meningitidis]ATL37734.1 hypothetical protein CQR34_11490 [Neisseria meningitidis]AUX07244.1 hypothetical protein BVD88_02080 [Neisseria meningitidis]OMH46112.1 hypothetical protein BWZ28_02755 [Neisseria meningitidis]OZS27986.1 hypothetical protein CG828_04900 [Neisseria meningitidis]